MRYIYVKSGHDSIFTSRGVYPKRIFCQRGPICHVLGKHRNLLMCDAMRLQSGRVQHYEEFIDVRRVQRDRTYV